MSTPTDIVIDINIFINAANPGSPFQSECVAFLRRVDALQKSTGLRVREPPLFVLEFFAVHNRTKETSDFGLYPERFYTPTTQPLKTTIEPFDENYAHEFLDAFVCAFPVQTKGEKRHPFVKRGADLEFLAVSRKYDCQFVTTDDALLEYGRLGFAKTLLPSDWILAQDAPMADT